MSDEEQEQPAKPKKPPRKIVSVRTSEAGDEAMRKIAKALGISISDARRQAFADFTEKHKKHL